jgi:RNA polymerase sigma-70 factor (ECF subfamily)
LETQTDSALMELVQGGETAQLALLFERHHVALFRYLLRMTRNRPLSEDLVQEVFFRVLKYANSYDTDCSFPRWLYAMAHNAYRDGRHKTRGEQAVTAVPEVKSTEPMPEELFASKQDVLFLEEALQRLPEEKREVLVLSRYHGLRYEDIADICKCEIGTVKVRAHRALKELRATFYQLRGDKIYEL